jgi:hypothetical protein
MQQQVTRLMPLQGFIELANSFAGSDLGSTMDQKHLLAALTKYMFMQPPSAQFI